MSNDTNKILGAIEGLSSKVDGLASRMGSLEGKVDSLEQRVIQGQQELHEMVQDLATQMDERFERVESVMATKEYVDVRFAKIESSMITKEYLDDKLADHGSRYGEMIRGTNQKIELMADALVAENSLSAGASKKIVSAEPFGRR